MSNNDTNEKDFLIAFEDLIKKFTDERSVQIKEKKGFSKSFIADFEDMQIPMFVGDESSASIDESELHSKRLDKQFGQFMLTLEETSFDHQIIPYDKITKSVFENTPEEDLDEFTEDLHMRGLSYFSVKKSTSTNDQNRDSNESDLEKMYFKILRHINLALIQKYTLMKIQLKEVEALRREQQKLINQYETLKRDAENQSRNMLTQFVTILGIFAAILMGAFGAIQGFANLFDNAHQLNLGIILIISSIGASSVLLILFFLLNGIAKLTGKNLSSTDNPDGTLIEKHPSLAISHGILILIALVGSSILLSNIKIQFAWSGFWWVLPIFWFVYLLIALSTKKMMPSFIRRSIKEDDKAKPIPNEIAELLPKKDDF